MKEKIKNWLGVTRDEYTRNFVYNSNMRASIYMSVVVICLELWMIYTLTDTILNGGKERTFQWMVDHYAWYVVLLTMGIIMLIFAIQHFRKGKKFRWTGVALLWIFSIVCIVFGMHFGLNSYVKNEQILAFLTMVIFVFCILTWKPLSSFLFSVVTFGGFFWLMLNQTEIEMTQGNSINLLTMWISTFMVALAAYQGRRSEASKTEDLEKMNAHLRKISMEDNLTGIGNMNKFREDVPERLTQNNTRDPWMVLFLNCSNFKSYNERYGFPGGDELLKKLAAMLTEVFEGDPVARVSDDHFVVLTHRSQAQERVDKAVEGIRELRGDVRMHLKVGGYAVSPGCGVDLACDRARVAADSIKKMSDRHYREYDHELEEQFKLKQYVINNIDAAIEKGYIRGFYQPVVKCSDGSKDLCGLEALARWDDPEHGLLPPYMFIDTLEEYREIYKLDRCIIQQVCRDLRHDLDERRDVVPVSLNFSRLDFELYNVPQYLKEMCMLYDIPPELLDVEITESALTDTLGILQENMSVLRSGHYSLWLDDFGSGYSSLNVLKDFNFNVLKIDMKFLHDFPKNTKSVPILTMIVSLAKQLDMVTLTEGVETEEQYRFLQSIGCDKAQGYLFGKPMPKEELMTKTFGNG